MSRLNIPKTWRIVVGRHAIFEALKVNPKWAERLWLRLAWESSEDLRELSALCTRRKLPIEIKPPGELDRISSSHQGAVLFMNQAPELDFSSLESKKKSVIFLLDGIEDPHNLGAILRTGWLMGVDGVLIPKDNAVGLTPAAHKVASGGAEHVPIEVCNNFSNPIKELKNMGYWVFGLSHESKQSLYSFKIPEKVVWAIGAEDRGLRTTTAKLCDELASIPQVNAQASYNASVAAAITLAETRRQQEGK